MTPQTAPTPRFSVADDGVGWVTFDDPGRPVNVLTEEVMSRVDAILDEVTTLARSARLKVLVFESGKADSFIAGADVEAIAAIEDPTEAEAKIRLGQSIFQRVADLPVPTVAAIHGVCVGGGVELSLACTHRVLSDSDRTRVGLPEVMLGILPAWGGTTRLPRLVGLSAALDLLLTGKQIPSRKALRMGFADRVVPAELFRDQVRIFAVDLPSPARRAKPGMITRLLDSTPPGRRLVLTLARRKVVATTGGHYPAPLRILDVLRRTVGKSVGAGLEAEARTAAELVVSPVSKNLIHVFHMREATRKGSGVSDPSVRPRPVDEMGVLGAGVMGGGIAQIAAYKGIRVRMKDIRHDAITGGLQHARALFDKAVRRKKLRPLEADQAMERISGSLDYSGFRTADLVVEAVVERMEVKKAVLREVEDLTRPGSVLSTNTSSLSVDGMAEALRRPEDFCGIHFFNPVDRMPLVEIVRGTRSSDATVATAYAFALKLGKVPVVVGDGPGFLVNRILGPYLNESGHLLADGGSIEEVDGAAKAFGMPMGPLRLIDEVGIDVSKHAGAVLHAALGDRLAPSPVLIALGDSGRLGRKGGSGFYRYEKGREKGVDPSVYAALGATVPSARRTLGHREIRRRLVTMMINEAARALEEGVVSSAAAVDLAMIMGTGFPPFRGGLLRFADTFHLRAVLDRTLELEASHGPRFAPPALLVDLADRDKGFYEAFPE